MGVVEVGGEMFSGGRNDETGVYVCDDAVFATVMMS